LAAGVGSAFLFSTGFLWGVVLTAVGTIAGTVIGFRAAKIVDEGKTDAAKGKNDE
jgi:hypothetical protein